MSVAAQLANSVARELQNLVPLEREILKSEEEKIFCIDKWGDSFVAIGTGYM